MSDTVYADLLAAGAPELPEGFFYRVSAWEQYGRENVSIVIRRRTERVPLGEHITAAWRGKPAQAATELIAGRTLIIQDAWDVRDDVDTADDLVPALAKVAREEWELWQKRNASTLRAEAIMRVAKSLEGDHP